MVNTAKRVYRGFTGLKSRTVLLLTCIVLVATGLTGAMSLRLTGQLDIVQSKNHAREMIRALAGATSEQVRNGDRDMLLRLATQIVPQGEMAYVIFTDTMGKVITTYQRAPGSIRPEIFRSNDEIQIAGLDDPQAVTHAGMSQIEITYPVTDLMRGGSVQSLPLVGYVRLGLSLASVQNRMHSIFKSVLALSVVVALMMIPLGYEVVRYLLSPIQRLASAARALAGGRLNVRVDVERRDEIGDLATAFNSMATKLTASQHNLLMLNAELEERVSRRTRDLESANQQLHEMACRDSLTDLYNRRHFNDLLSQLHAESQRYGTELSCVMIDLDNFKRVNDTLGHHVGDQLLQLTARVIRESVRESDVAVRFGGDEFAVLMPQTPLDAAHASAARILAHFKSELHSRMPHAAIASLSVGVATGRIGNAAESRELLNVADAALYRAKAGGKNRIATAGAISATAANR